jgi:hypothetical protein
LYFPRLERDDNLVHIIQQAELAKYQEARARTSRKILELFIDSEHFGPFSYRFLEPHYLTTIDAMLRGSGGIENIVLTTKVKSWMQMNSWPSVEFHAEARNLGWHINEWQ